MADIITLKDKDNTILYPQTVATAVYDSDGTSQDVFNASTVKMKENTQFIERDYTAIEDTDRIEFLSDDGGKVYASVDKNGVHGVNLNGISAEDMYDLDEEVKFTSDDRSETYASIGDYGVKAKNLLVLRNGNYENVKSTNKEYIAFDGVFLSNPVAYHGKSSYSLYYNISNGKFFKNVGGASTEVPARTDAIYVDRNGIEYMYKDVLRAINAPEQYKHIEDNEMPDLTSMVSSFAINDRWSVPANVYSLFDTLLGTDNKTDITSILDIEYPAYANGVSADNTDYYVSGNDTHETPAYKVYLYHIGKHAAALPSGRKMFIYGGEHGNERLAIYDTYVLAYNLIHSTHPFYSYIRNNFDVYILPMLSVYSVYHNIRVNANGVNINRNYPAPGWSEGGQGTQDYTGPTAGSEFETQVIMGLMDYLKPHITLDHHNYSALSRQFYCESLDNDICQSMGKALVGTSNAFIANYPSYFGTNPQLFAEVFYNYGYYVGPGKFTCWADNNGYTLSLVVEAGECVNYLNGEVSPNASRETYSHVVFELAEYTLRSTIGNVIELFTKYKFTSLNY